MTDPDITCAKVHLTDEQHTEMMLATLVSGLVSAEGLKHWDCGPDYYVELAAGLHDAIKRVLRGS